MEVVEFACGIPHLLKGQHSDEVGGGIDNWSVRQPLGVSGQELPRSTFLAWCRCGCSRWLLLAGIPLF